MIFGARVCGSEGKRARTGLDGEPGHPGMNTLYIDIHRHYSKITDIHDNISYVKPCLLAKRWY